MVHLNGEKASTWEEEETQLEWNVGAKPKYSFEKKKKQGRVEHIYFIEKKLKAKIKEKS